MLTAVLFAASDHAVFGASFVVDSTVDTVDANPGDGLCADASGACTLRAAIQETNALPGPDSITLPAGTYALTIPGFAEDLSATGDLDITDDLTISGAGQDATIIDGSGLDRVIHTLLSPGAAVLVEISSLTVRNGIALPTDPTSSEGIGGEGGGVLNENGLMLLTRVTTRDSFAAREGGGIANENGDLTIVDNAIINNEGGSGGGLSNRGTATVRATLVSGNGSPANGGGISSGGGSLTLTDSQVTRNTVRAFTGGGIYSSGTLTVERSFINENTAGISPVLPLRGEGGGVYAGVSANIRDSSIAGNRANNTGGGVGSDVGDLTLTNVTVSGNSAGVSGGGIAHGTRPTGPQPASMTLANVTVSGNSAATGGGGIANGGDGNTATANLTNVTMGNNSAGSSGASLANTAGDTVSLKNTILAGSEPGANCGGSITSGGHNLDSGNTCGLAAMGDIVNNSDPLLGPLQGNGGLTDTHALLRGSPAIDMADNVACPAADQRGVARPIDGNSDGVAVCDMGAYEAQASTGQPSTMTSTPAAVPSATPASLPHTGADGPPGETWHMTLVTATGTGTFFAVLALALTRRSCDSGARTAK
jgi:CSLREA domain-containing protein